MTDEKVETPRTEQLRRDIAAITNGKPWHQAHPDGVAKLIFSRFANIETELSAKCAELEATRKTRTEQFFRIGQLEAELERVKGEEEMVTRAYDAIFPYVPDAIPLDEKINELLKLYEQAEQRATTAEAALSEAGRGEK
jgi:chromosome segregation ATPase